MIHVVAAIIERNGKFLVAQRRAGSHLEFKWEFPGGKVNDGETPEESLARELYEELGVKSSVGEMLCEVCHDYGIKQIRLSAYRVDEIKGEFQVLDHEKIRWLSVKELKQTDLADADKRILPWIGKL